MAELHREGDIFFLTMTSGENRFNPEFIKLLHNLLDRVLSSPAGPAALVITSTGKFFSNGLDLDWMQRNQDRVTDFISLYQKLLARLLVFPIPTVAAINGHWFAGGMMFALSCDFRIVRSDRGFACMPEIDLHMPLSSGMLALLQAKITDHRTLRDAILLGKRYGGEESAQLGLVDRAVSESEVLPQSTALAQQIAPKASDRKTYGSIKKAMYFKAVEELERGDLSTLLQAML
jgi:enoyl-CoA hydratase/carnithine racemase